MNHTSKFTLLRNSLFNSSSWALNAIVVFIATPYYVFKLTIEGYGVYALLTSLVGFYNLIDFGLGQGVIKFVSEYKAKNQLDKLGKIIISTLIIQSCIGLLGSLLLILFSEKIIFFLNISPDYSNDALIGLYFCSIGFLFSMISSTFNYVLEGSQKHDLASKINVSVNFVLSVTLVLILYFNYGLKEMLISHVVFNIFLTYLLYIMILKIFPGINIHFSFDSKSLIKLFNFSRYVYLAKISVFFNSYFIKFIIGFLLGPTFVTFYEIPLKLVKSFSGLINRFFTVLFPFFSELHAKGYRMKIVKNYLKIYKYAITLYYPLFIILIIMSKSILILWMGEEFATNGSEILILLSIYYFFTTSTTIPINMAYGLEQSKFIAFFSLSCILICIFLVYPLSTRFGLSGVLYSMLLSQVQAPFLIFYLSKKILGIDSKYLFKNVFIFPMMWSVFFSTIYYLIKIFNMNFSILKTIVISIAFLFIYFFSVFFSKWINLEDLKFIIKGKK